MTHPSSENRSYRVTFAGVGRSKRTWTTILKQHPTPAILERLVRKSGALMSSDIECVYDSDEEYGEIIAGIRPVGAFRVEEIKPHSVCPACGPTETPCEHVPTASDFL